MKTTKKLFRNIPVMLTQQQLEARNAMALPRELKQILIGQLLGDAFAYRSSPTANTRFEWSFGAERVDYANYLATLLAPYCNTSVLQVANSNFRLKTVSLALFNPLHNLFYELNNETSRYVKVVPSLIHELISSVVLAHFIIGDGNYHKSEKLVRIYTNAYTYQDCLRLADAITLMGIKTSVRKDRLGSKGEQQYFLAIVSSQLNLLHQIVVPHMHPSMVYRVGLY